MLKKRQPMTHRQLILVPLAVGVALFLVTFGITLFQTRALGASLLFGAGTGFLFGLAAFMALYMGD